MLGFEAIEVCAEVAVLDGGATTSDAVALLPGEADGVIRRADRLVSNFVAPARRPDCTDSG